MNFNFNKEIKDWLPRYCMNCGISNYPMEIHHIKGRKNELHNSYLNAIMICKRCHDKAVQSDECAARYLYVQLKNLYLRKYKLNEKDFKFIEYYIKIYEPIIQRVFNKYTKNI